MRDLLVSTYFKPDTRAHRQNGALKFVNPFKIFYIYISTNG